MAASPIAEQVADAVRPGVESAGLVLEDVQVAPAGARTVVRVVLDLTEDQTGALGLDQVAEVSRVISDTLDALPALPGTFTLEVTSPGTSRPLTELRHFKRARTRLVAVTLVEGAPFTERLTSVEGEVLVFEGADGTPHEVPFAAVSSGQVEVELKRAASVDESDFEDFDGSEDTDRTDGEG